MERNQKRLIAKVKTTNGTFGTPVSTDLGAVYDKLRSGDNAERVRKVAFQATVSALAEGECEGTRRYLCVEVTGVIDIGHEGLARLLCPRPARDALFHEGR